MGFVNIIAPQRLPIVCNRWAKCALKFTLIDEAPNSYSNDFYLSVQSDTDNDQEIKQTNKL